MPKQTEACTGWSVGGDREEIRVNRRHQDPRVLEVGKEGLYTDVTTSLKCEILALIDLHVQLQVLASDYARTLLQVSSKQTLSG